MEWPDVVYNIKICNISHLSHDHGGCIKSGSNAKVHGIGSETTLGTQQRADCPQSLTVRRLASVPLCILFCLAGKLVEASLQIVWFFSTKIATRVVQLFDSTQIMYNLPFYRAALELFCLFGPCQVNYLWIDGYHWRDLCRTYGIVWKGLIYAISHPRGRPLREKDVGSRRTFEWWRTLVSVPIRMFILRGPERELLRTF